MYIKIVETAGESFHECDSISLPEGEGLFILWKGGEPEEILTKDRGPTWVYVMNDKGDTIQQYSFNVETVRVA